MSDQQPADENHHQEGSRVPEDTDWIVGDGDGKTAAGLIDEARRTAAAIVEDAHAEAARVHLRARAEVRTLIRLLERMGGLWDQMQSVQREVDRILAPESEPSKPATIATAEPSGGSGSFIGSRTRRSRPTDGPESG